jgi:hypothetical protein
MKLSEIYLRAAEIADKTGEHYPFSTMCVPWMQFVAATDRCLEMGLHPALYEIDHNARILGLLFMAEMAKEQGL